MLLGLVLPCTAIAGAPPKSDHVCAPGEGKAPCFVGRVRMCGKDGALAACSCPPGSLEPKAGKGACVDDPTPFVAACVVPDATLGKTLAVHLELGTLELPPLTTVEVLGASDAIGRAAKDDATDVELIRGAEAWESIEGSSAWSANDEKGAKKKGKLAARDQAVERAISVRKRFLARFVQHPRLDEQRVAQARALLRRAAYAVVGQTVAADRKLARATLEAVVLGGVGGAGSKASRDAAFMLAEQAVRDREWLLVIAHEERVLKWAASKTNADDHPFLAAASARLAQARLETADLARAKLALDEAISVGVSCSPRAECVSAASAARKVVAATWAATSTPARATYKLLMKGAMPRHERVRPLLQLAELYAHGSGSGCAEAAEEARAWEQIVPQT
ncbi:MAG: hypothetical protein HYV09_37895 [Deltaproteobacteria bacterium]|nr:hypothetical protein [Deltaproteobacteria bacterium]